MMHITIFDSVETLLESLTSKELAKTLRTIELLEEFGHQLDMPHSRHLSHGLLELRIRGTREIRIFYCFQGDDKAVLLHAYIKKKQKAPHKELEQARRIQASLP
jgi:phage-related protein